MDMNFKIATGSIKDFLGNSNYSSSEVASEESFTNLFDNLENDDEDSKDIDSNLLLGLLSNIPIQRIEENIVNTTIENTDTSIIEERDLTNTSIINNFYNRDKQIDINSDIKNNNATNIVENEEPVVLNRDEEKFIKEMVENTISHDMDLKNNMEQDYSKYDELEITSLINKNNVIESKNIHKEDNDLSKLQNILNDEYDRKIKVEVDDLDDDFNNDLNDGNNDNFIFIDNKNLNNDIPSINYEQTEVVLEIREESINEDIVKTVEYLKLNDMEEITIKISPRELGDMTIKLVKDLDEITVDITLNKEDLFSILNDNIREMTKHLQELNISVKDMSVNIKNQNDFMGNLNQEFNKKNQQNQKDSNKKQVLDNNEDSDENNNIKEQDNLNILI